MEDIFAPLDEEITNFKRYFSKRLQSYVLTSALV